MIQPYHDVLHAMNGKSYRMRISSKYVAQLISDDDNKNVRYSIFDENDLNVATLYVNNGCVNADTLYQFYAAAFGWVAWYDDGSWMQNFHSIHPTKEAAEAEANPSLLPHGYDAAIAYPVGIDPNKIGENPNGLAFKTVHIDSQGNTKVSNSFWCEDEI